MYIFVFNLFTAARHQIHFCIYLVQWIWTPETETKITFNHLYETHGEIGVNNKVINATVKIFQLFSGDQLY